MKESKTIKYFVLLFWMLFWGLSILDKIIPDVTYLWVGKDFFALFIKFFSSLGLKDPMFATIGLIFISALEVLNFVFYLFALINLMKGQELNSNKWFFRAILSSLTLFSLFSIADQIFGDRFQLLEHGLFWLILIASWILVKYISNSEIDRSNSTNDNTKYAVIISLFLTIVTSVSIFSFSKDTFSNVEKPVIGIEVIPGVYKFDFPFLADKLVWEKTINEFKKGHPNLKINYIYTAPSELNSKKKTHLLLYIFTKEKKTQG